ncbi:MAG: hypothetical protein V4685_17385 [Bacteroidota bacterium]
MYFKKKESWFQRLHLGPKILLILFIAAVIALFVFLFNKLYTAEGKILHLYFVPLLLGLMYELKRVTKKWSTVFIVAIVSFLISLLTFSQSKTEKQYVFENHLQMWPYFFLTCFILVALIAYIVSENVTQVTEGITLLFTISINYWIVAYDYWHTGNFIIKALIILNWIASLFTIYHSITYHPLGKENRVVLSLWYAITGLVLAADNCYQLYQLRNMPMVTTSAESWLLFFQYFLLGVSGIYIVQNLLLVAVYFLPSKSYGEMLSDVHDAHLRRFSNEQVYIIDALIVIIISVSLFSLNFIYQFVPVNFMIWATVSIMSLLLYLVHKIIA